MSFDAGGTKLDFYVNADQQGVTCMLVDDGKGFPPAFLNHQTNGLFNYHDKLASEGEQQKTKIVSDKRGDKSARGKEGLGVATIDRILNMTGGKFEICDVASVPGALKDKMQADLCARLHREQC